jgi:steroid 5-alpha reductase family enzyme
MNIAIGAIIIVFCYMTALFLYGWYKKDNSIIDNGWGLGFIILALYSFFSMNHYYNRHILITGLVILWGMRLSLHILYKNWGKKEDPRYAAWRKAWGKSVVWRSFFQVFMLQGIVMLIIAQPVLLVNASYEDHLTLLDLMGLILWIVGFIFEVVGDYQLLRFTHETKNHGQIMTTGLWRYTRHPNYFGEAAMWWGIFLIALSVPHGWTATMSPATITFLLLYVSGIPMAEQPFAHNADYKRYAKRTSAFFPWFPKK